MGNCRHGKLDGCAVCEEIEQLHVQLAGCGVAAMSNTRESLARAKEVQPGTYGFSASYSDVLRCVEREIQEREAKERAEAALLCPGQMRCAKCKFELSRRTLFALSGTVGAGTSETEPCPNGCGPLWPVTWEQEARSCYASLDRLFDEKQKAEAERDALAARVEKYEADEAEGIRRKFEVHAELTVRQSFQWPDPPYDYMDLDVQRRFEAYAALSREEPTETETGKDGIWPMKDWS